MHPIQSARFRRLQLPRGRDVSEDHAFLDQFMCIVTRIQADTANATIGIEVIRRLTALEVECAAPMARLEQDLVQVDEWLQLWQQGTQRFAFGRTPLEERCVGLFVGQPMMAAHHRGVKLPLAQLPRATDLHVGHEAQPIDLRLERTEVIGQACRQHRDDAIREIDRGATLQRIAIEPRARTHVVTDIRNRHDQPKPGALRLRIHRVIEIASILTVDGHERHLAQIDAATNLARIDALAVGLGLAQCLGTKLNRQRVARDRRLASHLHGPFEIKPLGDDGHRRTMCIGVARDARDHPVTRSGSRQLIGGYEATQAQAPINRVGEGRPTRDFDGGEKGRDASSQYRFHLAGIAPCVVFASTDSDTIARGQTRHLRRRQKHALRLPLDLDEAEPRAVRADDAFEGAGRTRRTPLPIASRATASTLRVSPNLAGRSRLASAAARPPAGLASLHVASFIDSPRDPA